MYTVTDDGRQSRSGSGACPPVCGVRLVRAGLRSQPGPELEALVAGSANVRWHALDVTDHSAIEALAAELAETPSMYC